MGSLLLMKIPRICKDSTREQRSPSCSPEPKTENPWFITEVVGQPEDEVKLSSEHIQVFSKKQILELFKAR
jgi:hypothetical protein